ncbi:hypothetical protein KIN20_031602 [Parelaphostrongylus tenuis]|uniref:Uncharacterized protein n=1 Tax=Parelaphostrongylus tenuis TaxID=148309 RepID=A0AAD5R5Q8_PARTN|nr:hypothetical protein KIN20_031602 [Parelaphostrongylus tenuis]
MSNAQKEDCQVDYDDSSKEFIGNGQRGDWAMIAYLVKVLSLVRKHADFSMADTTEVSEMMFTAHVMQMIFSEN